jgi:hypothetical protein
MVRHVCRSACWVLCVAALVAWLAPVTRAQEAHPIVQLAKKMAQPVDFPGIGNAKLTLREALDMLTKQSGVRFDVNERAFRPMDNAAGLDPPPGGTDVFLVAAQDKPAQANKPAAGEKPGQAAKPPPPAPPDGAGIAGVMDAPVTAIPKMTRVRLETVLKRILAGTIAPGGPLDYVLRRDGVEITTTRSKLAEFYRTADHPAAGSGPLEDGPADDSFRFLPLVQVEFNKSRLEDALKNLADVTDHSIVLDPRVADKAQVVTATLLNVPLDTAVDLLANMAGLKVLMRDRALYVTTKDNAEAMQAELRDRTPPPPALNPGMGPGGGFGPGFGPMQPFPPGAGQPLGPVGPGLPKAAPPDLARLQAELAVLRAELDRLRQLKGDVKPDR